MERAVAALATSSHAAISGTGCCKRDGTPTLPSAGWFTQRDPEEAAACRRKLDCSRNSSSRQLDGNWRKSRGVASSHFRVQCKMFVPGFGEKSPESKASDSLHNFFTYIAVKIVLSQLEDYNREGYEDLTEFLNSYSLKDGDKFCAALMRESFRHKALALRIMEVRSAYCSQDFEWDNLQKLCKKHMNESNVRLMREFLVETSEFQE